MLDRKRVKEAEDNVRSYLSEGLLRETAVNQQIMDILIRNGKESLRVAEKVNQKGLSELWVIVCSYYAMYYTIMQMPCFLNLAIRSAGK